MAIKKSDLYSSIWASCDELRGGMDASQYKDYVLTMLFVKYVSDKAKADPFALIEVPADASFDYLISLKGKSDGYCARSEPLFRWWVSQCSGDRWATSTGLGEPWRRQGRALMARP